MSGRSPALGSMSIDCMLDNSTASLSLQGELDLASAPALEERLSELEARGSRHLVVDLGALSFIDSTGLRILLQAHARAHEHGGELTLRPGQAAVQRVFEITGAHDVLRFESAAG